MTFHQSRAQSRLWLLLLFFWSVPTTGAFVAPSNRGAYTRRRAALHAQKVATFGMGCFWEPSESMLQVPGVVDTVCGYTGNPSAAKNNKNAPPPTYDNVCYGRQWVEGVRVVFDEDEISYPELLQAFFDRQNPKLGSRQYASIVFAHDADQRRMAQEWRQQNTQLRRSDGWMPSMTSIEDASPFYQAEGYHQEFWQKQRPRMAIILVLLAVATGILDPWTPLEYQSAVATTANASVLAILAALVIERKVDATVIELE